MASSRLQNELRKRKAFDSLEQEATLNVLRTSDQFQNRFGRLFRDYELTPSQYNVLRILRGEGKPMPCLEIADRMIQVVPAITGLIDRLEAAGMVARQRSENDRRVTFIEITNKAKKILAQIDVPLQELHHKLLGHLSPAELGELIRLLEKARESLVET
ncbi:MAG: MarR family transcriptional regulator [Pirellula sp.]